MGVRINLYAVDVPPLADFLAQTVGAALSYYAKHAAPGAEGLYFEDDSGRYMARPGMQVSRLEGIPGSRRLHRGQWRPLQEDAADALLRRPTRDYLQASSSFDLSFVLKGLCACSVDYVRRLISDERRFWLGSLLEYAAHAPGIAPADYARFVRLAQIVLRVYDCGKKLLPSDIKLSDFDFSVIPADDADCWMGVWSEAEAYFAVDFLTLLQRQHPTFEAPPELSSRWVESDEEWTRRVRDIIDQLMVLEELLVFQKLAVVSFIS